MSEEVQGPSLRDRLFKRKKGPEAKEKAQAGPSTEDKIHSRWPIIERETRTAEGMVRVITQAIGETIESTPPTDAPLAPLLRQITVDSERVVYTLDPLAPGEGIAFLSRDRSDDGRDSTIRFLAPTKNPFTATAEAEAVDTDFTLHDPFKGLTPAEHDRYSRLIKLYATMRDHGLRVSDDLTVVHNEGAADFLPLLPMTQTLPPSDSNAIIRQKEIEALRLSETSTPPDRRALATEDTKSSLLSTIEELIPDWGRKKYRALTGEVYTVENLKGLLDRGEPVARISVERPAERTGTKVVAELIPQETGELELAIYSKREGQAGKDRLGASEVRAQHLISNLTDKDLRSI